MVRLQAVSVGSREDLEALGRALEEHGVRPVVDRVFSFGQAHAAYAHLASRRKQSPSKSEECLFFHPPAPSDSGEQPVR